MTTSGFPPFPGAPGAAPGGAPGYAPPAQPGFAPAPPAGFAPTGFAPGASPYPHAAAQEPAFVLHIPADPTWQPIEGGDTLEKDGFYCAKVASEKVRSDDGKLQVIFTLELQDDDAMGKKVSKFLPDPRQTTKDTWFLWRGLMRSIYGTIAHGQQELNYSPGAFTGAFVYIKTEAYNDTRGTMRTGVGTWSTREEWEEARKTNRHRWPAKVSGVSNPGVGALPGGQAPGFGLPSGGGLPGSPSMGLPGAPSMPALPPIGVPMPGTAPMQSVPANPFPPPVAVNLTPGFGFPPSAVPPPAAASGFPPPPANGVPQPSAAGVAATFPGAPPR